MSFPIKTCLGFCTLTLVFAATTNQAADPPPLKAGDELVRTGRSAFITRALPAGPDRPGYGEFSEEIDELAFLADGRMMAITSVPSSSTGAGQIFLNRVGNDGQVERIGEVAPPDFYMDEWPLDLKVDAAGRLYLLTGVYAYWNPPDFYQRLAEIDPDDASTRSSVVVLGVVSAIAAAPDGLWAAAGDRLKRLDPATGQLGGPSFSFGGYGPHDMDVDSSGAVWFWQEGVCSPPCPQFVRLDPATGALAFGIGSSDLAVVMQDLAIRRRCAESETVRCLQGGRFCAELTWKDFAGATGPGRVAAGRSADTGLFYFFEEKNWELMVKVLNGCEQNGHFWVYGSASTTVEYTLTVTDLETGAVRIYTNPLGQLAKTITDGTAFACS